ncbi:serine hydrolase domain-containing protein [Aspergillus mulundensis]|uniref:Uncharacterized protein n=1 Tax=Aspergillus mulundensis TaxID=1810919 RepID=A0A3D8SCT7_9EURO|nr:Uncharacterized protein DSM5745_04482 [Aspergillus mulundensis]RDW84156.1 Uncharacterized protein DSM5745_04482 [Aspergillus mulundensis]
MRSLLHLLAFSASAAAQNCAFGGPIFPAPKSASSSTAIQHARHNFTQSLRSILRSSSDPDVTAIDPDVTSFAVQVYSVHEEQPLVEYYHTAKAVRNNTVGVNKVDEDTVFRIGSISKVHTVLLLLMETGDASFHEPISKYLPEIQEAIEALEGSHDDVDHVRWGEVTIGELVSQAAGLFRLYGFGDLTETPDLMSGLGFPPVEEEDIPPCGFYPPCNRTQFFNGLLGTHPVVPTSSVPIYSNDAFVLVGYILEALTGKSFVDLVEERLFERLNLTHSSPTKPADDIGIIPGLVNETFWDTDMADMIPTGGIYSSAKDMSRFSRAILTNELLSPALTRRWLKPQAHTADPSFSVGAPWEIYSVNDARKVDLYTKGGNIGSYSAMMGLSPDHDVGFTILVGGNAATSATWALGDLVTGIVIPALDRAAREEASKHLAGTYASGNETLRLVTDHGPGLKIAKWESNGIDILESLNSLQSRPVDGTLDVRLYPTGLESTAGSGRNGSTTVSFRSVISGPPPMGPPNGPLTRLCYTWLTVGNTVYGSVALDEFVFKIGEDGDAVSLSPRALRTSLARVRH